MSRLSVRLNLRSTFCSQERTGIASLERSGQTIRRVAYSLSLFVALPVYALSPVRQVSQYGHSAWRIQDGTLPAAPHAVAQTTDGYLWVGTEAGLIRFDGSRFSAWAAPAGEGLPVSLIVSLLGSRDGSLWIGTGDALARWKDGALTVFKDHGRINAIAEDRDRTIWVARTRIGRSNKGPLCRVNASELECYDKADGTPVGRESGADTLVPDPGGGLWVGSTPGAWRWLQRSAAAYFPKVLQNAGGNGGVQALLPESGGSVLVGTGMTGTGGGLQRLESERWTEYRARNVRGSELSVTALLKDRDGGLWIGTQRNGIYHVSSGIGDRFTQADGLSSDSIQAMFEDREGNIWVATSQGIDRFRDVAVTTVGKREGLSGELAAAVFASPGGKVWVSNSTSVDSFMNDPISRFATTKIPGSQAEAILEDHAGRIWIGVDSELMVKEHGDFRPVRQPDGGPLGVIFSLTEDAERNVYAIATGTPETLFEIRDLRVVDHIPLPGNVGGAPVAGDPKRAGVWMVFHDGRVGVYRGGKVEIVSRPNPSFAPRQIFIDTDGSMWGAGSTGIAHWKDGAPQLMTVGNGLTCNEIYSAIKDDMGQLWLYAACGVMVIPGLELEKWLARPGSLVQVRTFDALDGAHPGISPFQPVVSKAPGGRIWFATSSTLQFVDPGHLPKNLLPPPVRIEQITADRKSYSVDENLRLPALTRNLEIDYTALSFVAPQKVRFRYKLEGLDEDWQEPGSRRQAFYNDLPPRKYRFRVIACNNDGVWNQQGAVWDFSVVPAFYQTFAFQLGCISAAALTLWGLYQLRVRQVAATISARLDERMAERTRLAGELHDTVLQTVQATKMIADSARDRHEEDPARLHEVLNGISEWLTQATVEARAALHALRASTALTNDLAKALEQAARAARVTSSMKCVVSVEGTPQELHPIVRDDIYRIGNEAIRNAARHSGATELQVSIRYSQDLTLRIRDNGRGIEPGIAGKGKPGHFGLRGMQERTIRIHGKFRLMSRPGAGTEIVVVIPGKFVFRQRENGKQPVGARLSAFSRVFSRLPKRPRENSNE